MNQINKIDFLSMCSDLITSDLNRLKIFIVNLIPVLFQFYYYIHIIVMAMNTLIGMLKSIIKK